LKTDKPQSLFARLWIVASICSYSGLQGAALESVVAWLATCWWAWAVCWRLSQDARK